MMSNALAKWQGISLILRIIIGMIIGIAFALSVPGNTVLPIFGKVFVGLLKGIAPILVFTYNLADFQLIFNGFFDKSANKYLVLFAFLR